MSEVDDSQDEDFEAMLAESERKPQQRLAPGDTVRGRVVQIGREQVFVDLGGRAEASLDRLDVEDENGELTVGEGDQVEATVLAVDHESGAVTLGRGGGRAAAGTHDLENAHQHGLSVSGLVTAAIKGGFEVQVAGVRAFCPISQIDIRYVETPEDYVNQRHDFRVTRYEGGNRPNVVLSRRAILEEEARKQGAETRARIEVGSTVSGTVVSLKPYGAFVDLGGLEGMIHISELSFQRVEHPDQVLTQGQTVEVQVIKIEKTGDRKRPEKIGLSLRSLKEDPWEATADSLREGAIVKGKVVRLENFGAFVEIAAGVEGLVHISEISSTQRLSHPKQVLSVGADVVAQVLSVDRQKKRIGLSLKAAETHEEDMVAKENRHLGEAPKSLGSLGDVFRKSLDKK